jgi:hypothetical protein
MILLEIEDVHSISSPPSLIPGTYQTHKDSETWRRAKSNFEVKIRLKKQEQLEQKERWRTLQSRYGLASSCAILSSTGSRWSCKLPSDPFAGAHHVQSTCVIEGSKRSNILIVISSTRAEPTSPKKNSVANSLRCTRQTKSKSTSSVYVPSLAEERQLVSLSSTILQRP